MNNELLFIGFYRVIGNIGEIELILNQKQIDDSLFLFSINIEEAYFLRRILVTNLALEFTWLAVHSSEDAEFC